MRSNFENNKALLDNLPAGSVVRFKRFCWLVYKDQPDEISIKANATAVYLGHKFNMGAGVGFVHVLYKQQKFIMTFLNNNDVEQYLEVL